MTDSPVTPADLAKDDVAPVHTLDDRVGKCNGYGCECGSFVKGPSVHGWATCARPECRHTQHVHSFSEARAAQNVKRGQR